MDKLETLRHSAAHVLAQAVLKLFPGAHLAIGPPIDTGFYYDISNITLTEEDLSKIEKEMQHIINQDLKFKKIKVSRKEAEKMLHNQPYKLEILKGLKDDDITFYQDGGFTDLCAGPHVESTGKIKAFKLLKIAGAYWRGDSSKPMLTRIYGTAFFGKDELDNYAKMLLEAESRDHRNLGQQLDLLSFNELSPGAPFFHPKGAIIYNELLYFLRKEYQKRGYQEVITPLLYEKSLWETSGHWQHFKEDMFILKIDNRDFAFKPMNCPSHCVFYKSRIRSYRELPLRIADFAPLHRNELKGVLSGLTRVRKFSQDDAHIFVTEEDLRKELLDAIDFANYVYKKVFNFDLDVSLSTRPEKAMGDEKLWKEAEKLLAEALDKKKISYKIAKGEGAFYGPKIDFAVKDALNRSWQLATIQLDFQMPERFELTYEGKDGKKHRPTMIHRAILGSLERFIALLLESYSGKLPLWLSPVQVKLLTISDKNIKFAEEVLEKLKDTDIRAELDDRSETIARKVRDAQLSKIPLILVIGDREAKGATVAIRTLDSGVKFGVKIDKFIEQVLTNIQEKSLKISFK